MRGERFIVTVNYCADSGGGGGAGGSGPVAGCCRNLPANLTSFFSPCNTRRIVWLAPGVVDDARRTATRTRRTKYNCGSRTRL